jgi:hypothetical protein
MLVVLRYVRVNPSAVVPLHSLCTGVFFAALFSVFVRCTLVYWIHRYTDTLAVGSINTTLSEVLYLVNRGRVLAFCINPLPPSSESDGSPIMEAKCSSIYGVRQKYLTIWQHSCEWNRWRGEFVLERPSSETQSISVAMECWSVEHRAFAVETCF